MTTINAILKEMKDVPVNRLEEVYQFVTSMTSNVKQPSRSNIKLRKKILSSGGILKEMSDEDYADFISQTRKTREQLFDRKISL
ncbi:MAG: hypothetical protein IPI60_17550 [Saprospiraceae bacterium]|nr:hypothetical protein [Saprospiraceae bacterium]